MKTLKLVMIAAFATLTACNNKKVELPTYDMQVFEYNTTTPLPNVHIALNICKIYDNWYGGCIETQTFATGTTDNNGKYTFKGAELDKASGGVVLSKGKYWDGYGGQGSRYLEPEAWLT
jgi:hypothetical protein